MPTHECPIAITTEIITIGTKYHDGHDCNNAGRLRTAAAARILFHDFMASVVVFLVALPLCMGIAVASNVPVAAGLISGIVGGIVVGMLSGAPLQVSGPAAGLSVLVYQLVDDHGIAALGLVVLIAGIFQLVAGALRLGQWFRAVSPAVVQGMLAGIGVLIFASQFHVSSTIRRDRTDWRTCFRFPNRFGVG